MFLVSSESVDLELIKIHLGLVLVQIHLPVIVFAILPLPLGTQALDQIFMVVTNVYVMGLKNTEIRTRIISIILFLVLGCSVDFRRCRLQYCPQWRWVFLTTLVTKRLKGLHSHLRVAGLIIPGHD